MMFYCPVCGRRRFVHQPQFWPYRFDGEMFCSENCWICDSTRKIMERKGFKMARMKKDGTPAKKPGPKAGRKPASEKLIRENAEKADKLMEQIREDPPKVKLTGPILIETPEANRVEAVETPEKMVVTEDDVKAVNEKLRQERPVMPLRYTGYTVRCIEGAMGKFYYDNNYDRLDWTTPEGDEVSFSPEAWKKFATEELPLVMALLGVKV